MSRINHSTLLMATLTSAALISSCGGNSVMSDMDLASSTATGSSESANNGILSDQPFLLAEGKGASDLFDFPDIVLPPDILDPGFDIDAWWESLHNPVVEGDNAIPLDKWLSKSGNASEQLVILGYHEIFPGVEIPYLGTGMGLASAEGEMSYATYGLGAVPDGKQINHIHLVGGGSEGPGDQHGLYIGLGNYGKGAYQWFGPYDLADGEYDLDIHLMDNVNDGAHAYIVLATHDGDSFVASHLDVGVGDGLPDIILPELPELPEFSL
jgi:hypothetical protein